MPFVGSATQRKGSAPLPTCRPCLPTSVPHALIPCDFKVDLYEGDKKGQSGASPSSPPHSWTVIAVVAVFFLFILLLLSLLFPQSHRLTFTRQPAASTGVHDFHILHVGNLQPGCCRRDKRSRSLQAARCQIFGSARFCCSPVGFAKTKNRGVRFFTRWAFIVVQKCINWLRRRLRACRITASAIWRASR